MESGYLEISVGNGRFPGKFRGSEQNWPQMSTNCKYKTRKVCHSKSNTSESLLLSHDSSKCVCINFLKGNKWPKYQLSKHLDKEQSKTFFIITQRD